MKTFPGYVEFEGREHWLQEDAITTALRAVPVAPTPPGGGTIPAHIMAYVEGLGASYRASTGTNPFGKTLQEMRKNGKA